MSRSLSDTQTLLKQAIAPTLLLVLPDTSIKDAIATMNQVRSNYILIVKQKKLLKIFTESDVVKITASEMLLEGVPISQVMTPNLITLSLAEAAPGIAPEIMPRIFEPFFTAKPPGQGNGFGLNVVKSIIEKHQGKIEVESVPGQTRFAVSLPINLNEERNHV